MIDSDILDRYREGVRALLKAPKEDRVGTTVPEYQLIILEELLSSARVSIAGVCNVKKMFLWTEKVCNIIKDKIDANIDTKLVVANAGLDSPLLGLGDAVRKISGKVISQGDLMTVMVVDSKACMVVGPESGDDMVLLVGGDVEFSELCASFVEDSWAISGETVDAEEEHT